MLGPGLAAALIRCSISPEPLILPLLPQPRDKYRSPGPACSPHRPAAEQHGDHSLPLVREECPYLLASLSWQRPDGTHNPALPWGQCPKQEGGDLAKGRTPRRHWDDSPPGPAAGRSQGALQGRSHCSVVG